MTGYKESYAVDESNNWIYIGADKFNLNFSKVGKTTKGLESRHIATQSPVFFIYTAFNIMNRGFCNCDVGQIEKELLSYLVHECNFIRIPHFSSGSESECFFDNPDLVTGAVENFIERRYPSCVTYENSLHGWMSRFQCERDIMRLYQQPNGSINTSVLPTSLNRTRQSYFTGNQEEYTVDLGGGFYIDVSTGLTKHVDDDNQ